MAKSQKRKRSRMREMLGDGATCVYCGGTRPATTIDHMPPIALFDNKQRPKGLEFPSCDECNSGTKTDEQVASLISRMFPAPKNDKEEEAIKSLFASLVNNSPRLLLEMMPSAEQLSRREGISSSIPPNTHAMNASGPILNSHLRRFAAKLGMALHYEITNVALSGAHRIGVRWFSNVNLWTGEIPPDLMSLFPKVATLRQGKKQVGDQFSYSSCATDDSNLSAHFAAFRQAFAVTAFVGPRDFIENNTPSEFIYQPAVGGPESSL